MSIQNWPGGVINDVPPTPSGPFENSTASGVWTIQQAADYVKQGNWPTAGNVSPDAFIENLFQTWLYTGTGAAQTITNGIDLAGKGGAVWIKNRSVADDNVLFNTVSGPTKMQRVNTTDAQETVGTDVFQAFNSNGFRHGGWGGVGGSGNAIASWTFREQPKFFDVVTYTGNGNSARVLPHALASTPGCIIVKRTDSTGNWAVFHRASGGSNKLSGFNLNSTFAAQTSGDFSGVTETDFMPANVFSWNGSSLQGSNINGATYVAYLFAHNAGGFGLTGTDNVISCGSFTTNGSSAATVTLGYEPQWILTKRTDGTGAWGIYDTMRGWSFSGQNFLLPNSSGAEGTINGANFVPTATGFNISAPYDASATYIYIAIRRGPMKVPTTGTSVYTPLATPATTEGNVGFPADLAIAKYPIGSQQWLWADRLRDAVLYSSSTAAENSIFGTSGPRPFDTQNGVKLTGIAAIDYDFWMFRRAPSFFDEVCYTGTGNGTVISHNLTVEPELAIFKCRNNANIDWVVRAPGTGADRYVLLNTTGAQANASGWYSATSSQITFPTQYSGTASSGFTYVAYLFATCPGVSKVGSFTGTGATQVINCGFTGGARFVLIKATSTTGNWLVWDSARGIVAGNDPYLALNSTAAEVTNTDWVDTAATGFELSNAGGNLANSSGVSYIFLAIS
jgi:hypothetical protein